MLPDFRVRQRDYLLEISRALTEELNLPVLLTRILRITVEMLSGQAGFIALLDENQGWQIAVHQGLPQALSLISKTGWQTCPTISKVTVSARSR